MSKEIFYEECTCFVAYNTKRPKEDLEIWRDKIIGFYNSKCVQIDYKLTDDLDSLLNIISFPKCLVQIVRSHCDCDSDCVANFMSKAKFDYSCKIYDFQNLYFDINYRDCSYIDHVLPDPNIFNYNMFDGFENIKNKILILNKHLCDNVPEAFESLQCIAYDLRNFCHDNNVCMNFPLVDVTFDNCTNKYFNRDYRNFLDLIQSSYQLTYKTIKQKRSIEIQKEENQLLIFDNINEPLNFTLFDQKFETKFNFLEFCSNFTMLFLSFCVFIIIGLNNSKSKTKIISIALNLFIFLILGYLCCLDIFKLKNS